LGRASNDAAAGNDRMIWNPGDDSDLMEGGSGDDTAEVNGGNGAENLHQSPPMARVRFDRVDPAPFFLDIGTTKKRTQFLRSRRVADVRGLLRLVDSLVNLCVPLVAGLARASNSVFVAIGRQFSPAAEMELAPSFLWLKTVQCIERKQDLACLTPKGCFIAAEAVERAAGQVGEAQEAAREVGSGIESCLRPGARGSFLSVCDSVRCPIAAEIDRLSPSGHGVDDVPRAGMD
jgi:hypothetical protein